MSDEEWQPKMRPQSTMAQEFSATLTNLFGLDERSQTVYEKKQNMIIQKRELEELQERIRKAEEQAQFLRSKGHVTFGSGQQTSQGPEHPEPERLEQRAITEENHNGSSAEHPKMVQDQGTYQETNQDQSTWDSCRV